MDDGNNPPGDAASCGSLRRRARPVLVIASLILAGAILAACGGGHSDASSATPASTKSTTSSTAPSTSASARRAVLAAYRAASKAFLNALADANPDDPELSATMVDPQLQGVKTNLFADQKQGIVGRGRTTLHPKVVSMSATTATVVDCIYSDTELVYATSGKPVPPITPPEHDGIHAILHRIDGVWKLYEQTVTDGKCAPGS